MYEYWRCLGKALVDDAFFAQIQGTPIYDKNGPIPEELHHLLIEEGFRMSRFEVGEIYRLLRIEGFEFLFTIARKTMKKFLPTGTILNPDTMAILGCGLSDGQLRDRLVAQTTEQDFITTLEKTIFSAATNDAIFLFNTLQDTENTSYHIIAGILDDEGWIHPLSRDGRTKIRHTCSTAATYSTNYIHGKKFEKVMPQESSKENLIKTHGLQSSPFITSQIS